MPPELPPGPQQQFDVKIVMLEEWLPLNAAVPGQKAVAVVPRLSDDVNKEIRALELEGWLVINVSDRRIVLQKPRAVAVPQRPGVLVPVGARQ